MMTFENWLKTRQGKFFSKFKLDPEAEKDKEVQSGKQTLLTCIYQICKDNQFDPIPGVMLGDYWRLKNKDGSMKIPT